MLPATQLPSSMPQTDISLSVNHKVGPFATLTIIQPCADYPEDDAPMLVRVDLYLQIHCDPTSQHGHYPSKEVLKVHAVSTILSLISFRISSICSPMSAFRTLSP